MGKSISATAMVAMASTALQPTRGIQMVRADTSDPVALVGQVNAAFTEFRETNDRALEEIRAGMEDVVTTEKVDRINTAISEMQAGLDAVNAQLSALEMGGGGGAGVQDGEYTDAFMAHFRHGDVSANLVKSPDSDGGYLAPVEWDRTITDSLIEVSQMRQLATVQSISGAGFKKLFNLRGTASGWVGETAARPETGTPTFGQMTFDTGEIYANPSATQQMLDDAEVDLAAWLANEVQTEFEYQEGLAFVSGNGVNKPAGFLTFVTGGANAATNPLGAIQKVPAAGTALATDDILSLVYALPQAFLANAGFTMSRGTQETVRKLKDGQGNYIWQPSYSAGQPATLTGYASTELPAMPAIAASAIPIAFGDFRRGYLIVDRKGVEVLRDPYTNKPFVSFYTTKRVGGGVQNPQALKVLEMAAA